MSGYIDAGLSVITAKSRFMPGMYVWFGQPNMVPDPDNPLTLKTPYVDAEMTIPANPIQGIDSDSKFEQSITGHLYGDGQYSIRLMTGPSSNAAQIYYIPSVETVLYAPDAGTAAFRDVGTLPDQVPLNSDLGTAAYADVATNAQALAGTAGVLPDAAGVHAAIRGLAVGTVSQSGGVPTGAIIERGSNANGEYTKFADGTMICWLKTTVTDQAINTTYGSLFIGTRYWTFPMPFNSPPAVPAPAFQFGTSASWGQSQGATTTTGVTLRGIDVSSGAAGTSVIIQAIAIGRWY